MATKDKFKFMVSVLMESPRYFTHTPKERLAIVKSLMTRYGNNPQQLTLR